MTIRSRTRRPVQAYPRHRTGAGIIIPFPAVLMPVLDWVKSSYTALLVWVFIGCLRKSGVNNGSRI